MPLILRINSLLSRAYIFLLSWLELGEIGRNLVQTITKSLQFSKDNIGTIRFYHAILYVRKKYDGYLAMKFYNRDVEHKG